jgi:hypothetical protein
MLSGRCDFEQSRLGTGTRKMRDSLGIATPVCIINSSFTEYMLESRLGAGITITLFCEVSGIDDKL